MNKFDLKEGIILLVFTIMLINLNVNIPLMPGDDFIYSLKFEEQEYPGVEPIKSIRDYIGSQINHYNTYNNRIVPHAVLQALLLLPPLVFDILNTIVFLLIPLLLLRPFDHLQMSAKRKLYIYSLSLICLFHPAFGNAYLWTTGAVNYSWSLIPQIYFVGSLYRLYSKTSPLKAKDALASLFIAGSNEHVLLALALFTLLTSVVLYKQKRKLDSWLFVSLIIMCIGGVIMLLSPALLERFNSSGKEELIFGKLAFENLGRAVVYMFAIITTAVLLVTYSKTKNYKGVLFFASMIGLSLLIMIFTPLFEPRAAVFPYFISFMFVYSIITQETQKSQVLLYLLLTLSVYSLMCRNIKAKQLYNKMNVLESQINRAEANDTVYTTRLCVQSFAPAIPCLEISQNPNDLQNVSVSRYFNRAAIVKQSPERYWDKDNDGFVDQASKELSIGSRIRHEINEHGSVDSLYYYYKDDKLALLVRAPGENPGANYRIIARAHRKSIEHYIIDWIPLKYKLYFLDFIEEDSAWSPLNEQGYYAIEMDKPELYDYLVFSLYNKEDHRAFGEPNRWTIPRK